MSTLKFIFAGCLLCLATYLSAQETLPVPRNIQKAFDKGSRSTDGSPGKNYWQNAAAYDLQVHFDPATRIVSGEADITYTNHSPDTLREILFKLYPNLYKKGVQRLVDIKPADLTDGVQISRLLVNGEVQKSTDMREQGTNMSVRVKPTVATTDN